VNEASSVPAAENTPAQTPTLSVEDGAPTPTGTDHALTAPITDRDGGEPAEPDESAPSEESKAPTIKGSSRTGV
jgi:hypothetical protein